MWWWRWWRGCKEWQRCGGGGGDVVVEVESVCVLKERRGEKRWAYVCVGKRWEGDKR
ncbi:hypothetical protein HanRHA438_Chr15g0728691 [Helianthus annuus]|nr:hypothetical protein HanRHA438_Chr15g0728691 [Helianthus annuus]